MHRDDFKLLLIDVAGSKEGAQNLWREMTKQGFVAPLIAFTLDGRKARKELG